MDISDTILAKSDQLKADDLIHPVTVKVTGVNKIGGDQPVAISIEGDYQPFKPCKTMRRILVAGWGVDASQWVGRELTLYNDPEVVYAGQKVGGIRISHMSHIPKDGFTKLLSVSRGKRKAFTIKSLVSAVKKAVTGKPDVNERLPKAVKMVKEGKVPKETAIKELERHGDKLTPEQLARFD